MLRKRLQLGLIHVAVAITLVPINSTLNRVLIKEMAVSATLVAILAILPYLFSPIQVWIGSFSDRHPIAGYRRTPYILLGLLLCVLGVAISPQVAFLIEQDRMLGTLVGVLVFGAWGMGYNFSAVCYLSLASEISGEKGRGRTVAVMFVMMIIGIIFTALTVSNLVDPYTPAALQVAFLVVAVAALVLGLVGILRLEEKVTPESLPSTENYSWGQMFGAILQNRQATIGV
ncbi:MAG: MFS transporter [Anaerolineales bacterium]|nr:MFS transporter [Anaerolineales bacterium]